MSWARSNRSSDGNPSFENEVALVTGAATGIVLLMTARPDVVFSDIGMPGEDGYDLIRKIRALGPERGGGVPAIAPTADARAKDRGRAVVAGSRCTWQSRSNPSSWSRWSRAWQASDRNRMSVRTTHD